MRRKNDAHERLIASAIELIHARSYGAVSVEDLCARAGVQKGSFYYFFPSKRDLVLAAIDFQWEQFQQMLLEPEVPPQERLARFFTLLANDECMDPSGTGSILGCPFGNLAVELGTQDPIIRARVQEVFAGICAYLESALRELDVEAQTGMNAADTAQAMLAYYEGIMVVAKATNDAGRIGQLGRMPLHILSQVGLVNAPTQPAGASTQKEMPLP
jgi:TetR/AcrR family transcriptional regulator, transcriptional repressor for nem operon